MNILNTALTLGTGLFLLAGCTRASVAKSHLSFTAPAASNFSALSFNNRNICYAINVTGTGITSDSTNACNPPIGLLAGYVQPGQNLEIELPSSQTVKMDLYLFLQPAGNTCPTLGTSIPQNELGNLYLVASASNIDTTPSDITVTLTPVYPTSSSQNVVSQLGLPATCQTGNGGSLVGGGSLDPSPFSISAGGEHSAHNSQYNLSGHVGGVLSKNKTLSNSQFNLIVR